MDDNEDITIEDMLARLDPADVAEMRAILDRQHQLRQRKEIGYRVVVTVAFVALVAVLSAVALGLAL